MRSIFYILNSNSTTTTYIAYIVVSNAKWLREHEAMLRVTYITYLVSGPGSSVGIAPDYRLDTVRGSNPGGAIFSAPVQTGPGAHPTSCTMGTGSFPGVKCGWGVLLTTHPLLMPRQWKNRAIPIPTLWATAGL
jgi:hypothetical protein